MSNFLVQGKDNWQPGGLGILRGVVSSATEEARTHSFPSLTFDRFGLVDHKRSSDFGENKQWICIISNGCIEYFQP
jgi:hypothetical protein